MSLFSAAAGICALFIPWFEQKWLAAAFIIIAIGASSIALYDKEKAKYAEAGGLLTGKLHELRMLYQKVKEQPDDLDLPDLEKRHEEIQREALGIGPAVFFHRSASDSSMPGGQPSTMATRAGPWLSPAVVTVNSLP